jgi:hypothetical protein
MTMSSVADEFGELELAETPDAGSSSPVTVVGSGMVVVTMADAPALPVVDVGTVVLVTGLAVAVLTLVVVGFTVVVVGFTVVVVGLGFTVVVVGFTVVVVGFTVVVVGLAVVVVTSTWHPGLPWPAGGLQVLPGWALAGPAYTQAPSPITTATAQVMPNARTNERGDLFLIFKPPLSHTAAPFGRCRYLLPARRLYRSKVIRAIR